MNPISQTAFYSCGVRMLDAQRRRPICNDIYAERFMDQHGREILQRFGAELDANTTNVARHRYIDDELRRRLAANAALRVILIGCGFDSRAFRLSGGAWIELDEPAVIAHKNEKLPADSCPNSLVRIPIEFATEPLTVKLEGHADDRPALVILEGVTMYLPSVAIERASRELRKLFTNHEVLVDLMTRDFADQYGAGIKQVLTAIGVNFEPLGDPATPFVRAGYRETHCESVIGAGLSYQHLGWLRPLMRRIAPNAGKGYTVRTFV